MKRLIFIAVLLFLSLVVVSAQVGNLGVPTPYPQNPQWSYSVGPLFSGAFDVGIADVNGDGSSELIIPRLGSIVALNRLTNTPIVTLSTPFPNAFGANLNSYLVIKGISDVNSDTIDDVLVGIKWFGGPLANAGGFVYIYSGATGAILNSIQGSAALSSNFGISITTLGDINGNNIPDFAVGEPSQGVVHIIDGNGATITTILSPNPTNNAFGIVVANAGDVNVDGVSDVIVKAQTVAGTVTGNVIYVFSGAAGSLIYTFSPPQFNPFPQWVDGNKDYNFDGTPDIFIGDFINSLTSFQPRVHIFSGANGALLTTIVALNQPASPITGAFNLNAFVAGDLNGDSFSDVAVISHINFSTTNFTRTEIFLGPNGISLPPILQQDANFIPYFSNAQSAILDQDLLSELVLGEGLNAGGNNLRIEKLGGVYAYPQGLSQTLQATWSPNPSQGAIGNIIVTGLMPSETLYTQLSSAPFNTPLPSGDLLLINPNMLIGSNSVYQADASGTVTIPNIGIQQPNLAGQKVYGQAFVVRNSQIYSSNGIEITFLP